MKFGILSVPGCAGQIAMTSLPGAMHYFNPPLELDDHLKAIREWGAVILLSLNEEWEYSVYGDAEMPKRIPEGIRHIEMPIRDRGIPDARWEEAWAVYGYGIRETLKQGGKICVHCVGGHGRTGTIVARILVEFGMIPTDAIHMVRSVCPKCIETTIQENYIQALRSGR